MKTPSSTQTNYLNPPILYLAQMKREQKRLNRLWDSFVKYQNI